MLLNRPFWIPLAQILAISLFTAWGAVALAQVPIMPEDEEEPCPLNAETAAPTAEPGPLCSSMPADLARAAAEWSLPVAALNVRTLNRTEGDADIPLGTKVKVTLFPFKNVSLPANPGKTARMKDFAGLLSFHSGKAGTYRFLLSQYAWLEIIDASGKLSVAMDSDRRLDTCSGMGRNVSFELAGNTRYWLQVSGAKRGAELELVISAPQ
jgi:hypothetical protein